MQKDACKHAIETVIFTGGSIVGFYVLLYMVWLYLIADNLANTLSTFFQRNVLFMRFAVFAMDVTSHCVYQEHGVTPFHAAMLTWHMVVVG